MLKSYILKSTYQNLEVLFNFHQILGVYTR